MARAIAAVSLGSNASSTHGPPALLVAPTEKEDPPADEATTARLLEGTMPPELELALLVPPLVLHPKSTPTHNTPAARFHAPRLNPCIISRGSLACGLAATSLGAHHAVILRRHSRYALWGRP